MNKQILNNVMVEVWDTESGLDIYENDLDTIDLRLTVYKTNQEYPDIYKSMQLGVDQFAEAMGRDIESAFGFTEWMTGLYALTQYSFPKEIQNFIIYTIAEQENITVAEIEQMIAHEKNELAKLGV
jgi:hypothetical protein